MSRRGSPHAAFGRALAWGGGQRHGGAPRTGQVLDRDEDEGGSHGPGAGSCVRAPPHPPVWIARWDSSYQSRATRSDFRNRFRFPAEPAGWSCPETAPFFFDRRVPGRKFVIAVADRARSAPGRLSRLLRPGYTMPASETRLFSGASAKSMRLLEQPQLRGAGIDDGAVGGPRGTGAWPELTKRADLTHKRTNQERPR
jgi:hypothetical protein